MKKLIFAAIIIFIAVPAYAQSISDHLILNDIGIYKRITKGGPSGNILAGTKHFGLDHKDISHGISYVNDEAQLWIDVQVTQHAGADSDKWLLHEVERSFRYGDFEEDMTPSRFRKIDGNNIFYSKLGGGGYRWISNNIVIDIEYTDLYQQKPEPLEVVKAYLAKHPSTIPDMAIDNAHNEKWIKDEMERRLWLCDKWFMQLQLGKAAQEEVLKESVEHMEVFLNYREKYYGISGEEEKDLLDTYLGQKSGTEIKNRLETLKQWWTDNKENPINL